MRVVSISKAEAESALPQGAKDVLDDLVKNRGMTAAERKWIAKELVRLGIAANVSYSSQSEAVKQLEEIVDFMHAAKYPPRGLLQHAWSACNSHKNKIFVQERPWIDPYIVTGVTEDGVSKLRAVSDKLGGNITEDETRWLLRNAHLGGETPIQTALYMADMVKASRDGKMSLGEKTYNQANEEMEKIRSYERSAALAKGYSGSQRVLSRFDDGWTVVLMNTSGRGYIPEGDADRENVGIEEQITGLRTHDWSHPVLSVRDPNGVPQASAEIDISKDDPRDIGVYGAVHVSEEGKKHLKQWVDIHTISGGTLDWSGDASVGDVDNLKDLGELIEKDEFYGMVPHVSGFGGCKETYLKNINDTFQAGWGGSNWYVSQSMEQFSALLEYAIGRNELQMLEDALMSFDEKAHEDFFDWVSQSSDYPSEEDFKIESEYETAREEYEHSMADEFEAYKFSNFAYQEIQKAKTSVPEESKSNLSRKQRTYVDTMSKELMEHIRKTMVPDEGELVTDDDAFAASNPTWIKAAQDDFFVVYDQKGLNDAVASGKRRIRIDANPDHNELVVSGPNIVFEAIHHSRITTAGPGYASLVIARDESQVTASGTSLIEARDSSCVRAWASSSVTAMDSSKVLAWEKSTVTAKGSSRVDANHNVQVTAMDDSIVEAGGCSHVDAYDRSRVKLYEDATITRHDPVSPYTPSQSEVEEIFFDDDVFASSSKKGRTS